MSLVACACVTTRRFGPGDDWNQKRLGGTVTPPVLDVLLVIPGTALWLRRAEIPHRVRTIAKLACRSHKGDVTGMRIHAVGHTQCPAGAAVSRRAARVVFHPLEHRQHIVISPRRIASLAPAIEVEAMASDVGHRIDCARAADDFATRESQAASTQARFVLGRVSPIERRANQADPTARCGDGRCAVIGRPRFEQQHPMVRLGAQAIGDDAPADPAPTTM